MEAKMIDVIVVAVAYMAVGGVLLGAFYAVDALIDWWEAS